ncbi:MAG TPA: FadR/GntR family transcriptional regulator [Denitromonas sp.]|uniref:FadR/GntR family transcriptional regulator n=1 Tax=Denitromonas sp. TaxID=2734609 RepID=UPI001D337041|nr:FadR family transcriptional regulator [Rhodocyclaceae bacterium]MCP5221233.1 FadR family transcriptional regulator [Zoogloeaceae bacterium]HPR08715.1 FadR/GntR family transcriptional regulator [Denitromonas sp.]HQU89973.1 FadR/GntR family transcriptional regulator [Denitromonas sp.]HQV14294.1 FadR/GntR family transcriptional regulator [Denitromonas sp.]
MARRKAAESSASPELSPSEVSAGDRLQAAGPHDRLSDQLYGKVFEEITSGRVKVGEQLPSEVEISERFGVSRPVVREALLRLRVDGLITSHQGRGTFVSHQPAPRIKTFAKAQDIASYLRCQEARITLEGDTARLAAERHTDEQFEAILAAHDAFAEGVHSGKLEPAADLDFHGLIAEASGNEFYSSLLESIHEAMTGLMRLTLGLTRTASKKRALTVLGEHAAIVEAIRAREGEEARVAMQFHLGQARRRLIDGRSNK